METTAVVFFFYYFVWWKSFQFNYFSTFILNLLSNMQLVGKMLEINVKKEQEN